VTNGPLFDRHSVHVSSVPAFQIANVTIIVGGDDYTMPPRQGRIVNEEQVCRIASNRNFACGKGEDGISQRTGQAKQPWVHLGFLGLCSSTNFTKKTKMFKLLYYPNG